MQCSHWPVYIDSHGVYWSEARSTVDYSEAGAFTIYVTVFSFHTSKAADRLPRRHHLRNITTPKLGFGWFRVLRSQTTVGDLP
jgi:hypothetical protein